MSKMHIEGKRIVRRRTSVAVSALVLVSLCGCSGPAPDAAPVAAQLNEEQQTLYALGAALANNLRELELTADERAFVLAGFQESAAGEAARVDVTSFMPKIQSLHLQRQAKAIAQRREQGAVFLDQQAAQSGAMKTATGLVYQELTAGSGRGVAEHDTVTVHYEGKLPDGKVVDSSRKRAKPTQFRVNGVIACWKEALLRMNVGGRSRVVCPADLAYGNGGSPPVIPPGATLDFDIELIEVSKPDDPRGS
ncbi:FKBP-type peptidyl-prolyl cis-trans isomerase FkpA [Povalibacter uvarum]|uniref:Peptidyl-prolyl cis-trans isomerase n=1 Tax=Povalibacter uvarum TaxID=732238 RepID=A0A841HN26_9GAMM|nr:FKBP-type peptidyl-prolyl cis-trans isomerase [Povalibacter uvarum]MBB6093482.1 FKBP-type peptidyl-prolyl cis-trans isomerase FkpA [Povalibacter uvarum]